MEGDGQRVQLRWPQGLMHRRWRGKRGNLGHGWRSAPRKGWLLRLKSEGAARADGGGARTRGMRPDCGPRRLCRWDMCGGEWLAMVFCQGC